MAVRATSRPNKAKWFEAVRSSSETALGLEVVPAPGDIDTLRPSAVDPGSRCPTLGHQGSGRTPDDRGPEHRQHPISSTPTAFRRLSYGIRSHYRRAGDGHAGSSASHRVHAVVPPGHAGATERPQILATGSFEVLCSSASTSPPRQFPDVMATEPEFVHSVRVQASGR